MSAEPQCLVRSYRNVCHLSRIQTIFPIKITWNCFDAQHRKHSLLLSLINFPNSTETMSCISIIQIDGVLRNVLLASEQFFIYRKKRIKAISKVNYIVDESKCSIILVLRCALVALLMSYSMNSNQRMHLQMKVISFIYA